MELSVTQENLARSLSNVGRAASSKAELPILKNILLRTDGTRLLVAATNLNMAATHYINTKITKPGSITVPPRLVTEFVSSLPPGVVTLTSKGTRLSVVSGRYSSVINGIAADDFPELPIAGEAGTAINLSVDAVSFKRAVTQTIMCAGSDSTRPVLTGVFFHSHEGRLYVAATDGYRLAERSVMAVEDEFSAIIPASTLQEVLRTMTDDATTITITLDDIQVRFGVGDAEITSRLIDGKYPDYRQLMPASSETTTQVDTQEFLRISKIAGLFARSGGGSVTITADSQAGTLAVSSVATEYGENSSSIEVASISGQGSVTLNSRYLNDALGAMSAERVEFRFSGKLSPCVLKPISADADYTHIIMPLKS